MVICLRQPSAARSMSSTKPSTGSHRHSGLWAPLRDAARNGPSRCTPRMSERMSICPRIVRRLSQIVSNGLVIRLSTCRVVPCDRWPARASSIPSTPSSNDAPHAPWAWISTYPGVMMAPEASMTAVSGMLRLRQAVSQSSSEMPTATSDSPSDTTQA